MKLLRKVRKNDANDYARARKMHVKADAKSLTDAIIKMDNVVKAANNSELKKRWKDFLFIYNNLAMLAEKPK